MHQENFLSSSLREDVEGKEGERRRMNKESRKREVEEKRERFDFSSERTCPDRKSTKVFEFLCLVSEVERVGNSLGFSLYLPASPLVVPVVTVLSRMRMWIVRLLSLTRIVNLFSRRPFLPSENVKQVWLWSVRQK